MTRWLLCAFRRVMHGGVSGGGGGGRDHIKDPLEVGELNCSDFSFPFFLPVLAWVLEDPLLSSTQLGCKKMSIYLIFGHTCLLHNCQRINTQTSFPQRHYLNFVLEKRQCLFEVISFWSLWQNEDAITAHWCYHKTLAHAIAAESFLPATESRVAIKWVERAQILNQSIIF